MSGLALIGAALAVFLLAIGAVAGLSLLAMRWAGMAMNRNRAGRQRFLLWALVVASVAAIPLIAGLGFFGIGALTYYAQSSPAP